MFASSEEWQRTMLASQPLTFRAYGNVSQVQKSATHLHVCPVASFSSDAGSVFCAACDNWLIEEDLSGWDLVEVLGVVDRHACLAECRATVGCGALTYDVPSSTCWLKVVLPSHRISSYRVDTYSIRNCNVLQVRYVACRLPLHHVFHGCNFSIFLFFWLSRLWRHFAGSD